MKRYLKTFKFLCIASLIAFGLNYTQAASRWQPVKGNITIAKTVAKVGETEILTAPAIIYLSLGQSAKVEVFTILGRLVCEENLHPGTYELQLETHGVFIIKIGDVTSKVAI